MKLTEISDNEIERLKTLKDYEVLDSPGDPFLDEITKIAQLICHCKIAIISLTDKDRQWFKSKQGIEITEVPRDISFCRLAIAGDDLFVVENAGADSRFCDNPLVLNQPHIRFYAGAPLIAPNGRRIGALCVIDDTPKTLTPHQQILLTTLSKQIINYMELKKKSNELLLNQTKLSLILNNMFDGMIVQDSSGKIVEFNSAALEILGLTKSQLLGMDSTDPRWNTIRPDGTPFPGNEHPAMLTLATGKCYKNILMGVQQPDRNLRWISINSAPTISKDGAMAITTFRDITEQMNLQREIKEAYQYMDFTLEGAGLGIWDWNLTNNSVKFDKRWAEMLGLDVNEIKMELSTWESRVHPDDLKNCYADINAYIEGRTPYYENIHRIKHTDGHWVHILDRGRFSAWDSNKKPIRFTGTHFDISEAHKAFDEKLAELTDILSATPSCLKIITKDGILLSMNKQGLSLIEASDLQSVHMANVYDLIDEAHREKFISFNERICAGARESLVFKVVGLKGTKRWMETYAAPYKLPNGEIAHIAITNDITNRIENEKELKKQKILAQHQAKLAAIGLLAAGVGHEINNPLAIIKAFLYTMDLKVKEQNQDIQRELLPCLTKIDSAVERIANIVKGLRTFTRNDSSEIAIFSPSEATIESFNLVHEILKKEGIQIRLDNKIESTNITMNGNRGNFQQILMNLITNSRDAVSGNKLKLIDISTSFDIDTQQLILKVKDNGCGIPKYLHEMIFDPFFTTKEVNQGTGIGLSLVQNFVKEMKGIVHLESEENKGTIFTIEFPAVKKMSN